MPATRDDDPGASAGPPTGPSTRRPGGPDRADVPHGSDRRADPEPRADVDRYRRYLQDERESAFLYRTFADLERDPNLQQVYRRLADVEERHAGTWEARLREAGRPVPGFRPGWRTRTLAWLARRFSAGFVLPTLTDLETRDSRGYAGDPEAAGTPMAGEERSHARLLRTITRGSPAGLEGGAVARLEGRHRAGSGNALRAAVLGASDGLLSNFSLVMGVAGADPSRGVVLLAGSAGLLAGAFSMALGEWISVQSSRELYERQIGIERAELETRPEEEREELALIYQAKGLARAQAERVADRLTADPATALDALVREELGIDPEELGGSAYEAAFASFGFFAVGAILPLLPFALLSGWLAVAGSVGLSVLGLFAIGAAITLQTGRSVWRSGGRQVLVGLAAAAVTYGVGRLLGVSLGG